MALKVGDKAPHFTAKAADGELFDSANVIGKKAVVLYFYPKDNTPICTEQACSFRDNHEVFAELGATVIGVSSDAAESHQHFAQKYQLPFTLVSDQDKKIRQLFGVPSALFGLLPGRVTYVIDAQGIVRLIFDNLAGKVHVTKALEMLKRIV